MTQAADRPNPAYMTGFGNEFATEAVPGALPAGRNSPQVAPYGLYAEQLSGSAFTAPRPENRRSWLYRIRPAAAQPAFTEAPPRLWRSGPFDEAGASPNRLRWNPLTIPPRPVDFIDGMTTIGGNGSAAERVGVGIHVYRANQSMIDRYFYDADGELLIVPQEGALSIATELGRLDVAPGEIALIPRGVRFGVALEGPSRGYVCENYGQPFRLPDLGPIGANGLANPRDFLTPVAAYEDRPGKAELLARLDGAFWTTELDASPLDVVAWHGNYAPCKYALDRFNAIGSISFDHPDPSIFTVLTSPAGQPGTANVDFVVFPPRWLVAEGTFRPPWFHRNLMSEFMGLIHGVYDAKAEGFMPGGFSLHNCFSGHGPDAATFERASAAELQPERIADTLAFMFETRLPIRPTRQALASPMLQPNYDDCWKGLERRFTPPAP